MTVTTDVAQGTGASDVCHVSHLGAIALLYTLTLTGAKARTICSFIRKLNRNTDILSVRTDCLMWQLVEGSKYKYINNSRVCNQSIILINCIFDK